MSAASTDSSVAPDRPSVVRRTDKPAARRGKPRLTDRVVHYLSHKFILSRRSTTTAQVLGLRLTVPPTVFHPRYFLTSEYLAGFVAKLDLTGRRVADIGTGTGILALAAARSGAASVMAIDINPRAARAASDNAHLNGLGPLVTSVCADLFSSVRPGTQFDVIVSNPPVFSGEPLDLADKAWTAGVGYRNIAPLFDQARARLAPGGAMYVVLSSHAELDLIEAMMVRAGFRAHVAAERSIIVERLLIYELRPA